MRWWHHKMENKSANDTDPNPMAPLAVMILSINLKCELASTIDTHNMVPTHSSKDRLRDLRCQDEFESMHKMDPLVIADCANLLSLIV